MNGPDNTDLIIFLGLFFKELRLTDFLLYFTLSTSGPVRISLWGLEWIAGVLEVGRATGCRAVGVAWCLAGNTGGWWGAVPSETGSP